MIEEIYSKLSKMLDNAVPMYVQGGKKKINNAMLTDLQIYVETKFKYL